MRTKHLNVCKRNSVDALAKLKVSLAQHVFFYARQFCFGCTERLQRAPFITVRSTPKLTEYLFCFKYVPNLDRMISFFDLRLLLVLLFVVRFDVSAISISSQFSN